MATNLSAYFGKKKSRQFFNSIAAILSYVYLVFLILITGIAVFIDIANSHDYNRTVTGTVTKIIDGDTIHLTTPEQTRLKVRLYGIDAQESYYKKIEQPYGEESKKALSKKIMGKEIKLDIITVDKYRRMVGIIWLGDRNINLEMVREGHAEAFIEYLDEPYRAKFINAEKEAKVEKKGIWALAEYERPTDFRKRMKVK